LNNIFKKGEFIMKLTIAGETKEVKDGITIAELIVQEDVETPEYVTVSVNDDFAQRENFETQKLQDGDNVEFLYFMGGGQ
jgi:sulfur carrier protein